MPVSSPDVTPGRPSTPILQEEAERERGEHCPPNTPNENEDCSLGALCELRLYAPHREVSKPPSTPSEEPVARLGLQVGCREDWEYDGTQLAGLTKLQAPRRPLQAPGPSRTLNTDTIL